MVTSCCQLTLFVLYQQHSTDMIIFFRFSLELLYEFSLNILHYQASFSAMANHYHDFYLGNYTDLELEKASSQKERVQICEKRLSEGWMLYSLLEIKQRYQIPGIIIVYVLDALLTV